VLNAFGGFSRELQTLASEFFEKGWIDAEPRPGKSGGAFCASITPDTHPVILLTFLGKLDDAMVLAHELGHGVHGSLSRSQSYFNFHGTLPLAELASTFGEMLVFERLVADADLEDRLSLYAEKIESVFATVFRQAAMYRFEQRCHRERRESGELPSERFGEIWQEELQAMFGDSLKLGDQHKLWWSYVSHFFMAPFYVYAYSFGELLALSLYGLARAHGEEFRDKYLKLLRLGGSRSPQELMAAIGVDLRDRGFWAAGLSAVEDLVAEFERIWAKVKEARRASVQGA
jgi:oligoendopeptidase F